MTTIDISRIRDELDEILRRAEAGETVVVTRGSRPAFSIVPGPPRFEPRPVTVGALRGQVWIADDFDQTPEGVIRDWESAHDDPA